MVLFRQTGTDAKALCQSVDEVVSGGAVNHPVLGNRCKGNDPELFVMKGQFHIPVDIKGKDMKGKSAVIDSFYDFTVCHAVVDPFCFWHCFNGGIHAVDGFFETQFSKRT